MLADMGINVIEAEEAEEHAAEETVGRVTEERAAPARPSALPSPRLTAPTIPVRMYLREMGSVELLSREGEIAIAKRIEAGREAMIAGLCESPLTFQGDHHLAGRAQRRQDPAARHHRS